LLIKVFAVKHALKYLGVFRKKDVFKAPHVGVFWFLSVPFLFWCAWCGRASGDTRKPIVLLQSPFFCHSDFSRMMLQGKNRRYSWQKTMKYRL
jgi:hypothetical protein